MLRNITTACLIACLALALSLSACGQSGDLRLPPKEQSTEQQ